MATGKTVKGTGHFFMACNFYPSPNWIAKYFWTLNSLWGGRGTIIVRIRLRVFKRLSRKWFCENKEKLIIWLEIIVILKCEQIHKSSIDQKLPESSTAFLLSEVLAEKTNILINLFASV